MKILEDKNNELLNRREIKIIFPSQKNPSFAEAIKLVGDHFKTAEDLITVREIQGKFGRGTFLITSRIYKTKEEKENLEKKKVKKQPGQPAAGGK